MNVIEYDGPETAGRIGRATILMIRAAMDKIEQLGYTREEYTLDTDDGSFPFTIVLCGKPTFQVDIVSSDPTTGPPRVYINSHWIKRPSPKGFWRKLASFFYHEVEDA